MLKGIFTVHDTHGYPLVEILKDVHDKDHTVDWRAWINDALNAGWNYDQCKRSALGALGEVTPRRDFSVEFVLLFLIVLTEWEKKDE